MNTLENVMRCVVQHYNPKKYWKYRQRVVSENKLRHCGEAEITT